MVTDRIILNVSLLPAQADLVEKVARFRAGQFDPRAPVDLGAYIFHLLDRDIAACIGEIKARRGT